MSLIEKLQKTPARERLDFVREHEPELDELERPKLDKVGSLLCQASTPEAKKNWPIVGDAKTPHQKAQEVFEDNVTAYGIEFAQQLANNVVEGKKADGERAEDSGR